MLVVTMLRPRMSLAEFPALMHELQTPPQAPDRLTNPTHTKQSDNLTIAMYLRDDWPSMPDGEPYDGKNLLQLTLDGKSPFDRVWDVRLLIQEIEEHLYMKVTDIHFVDKGSNNYVSELSDHNAPTEKIPHLTHGKGLPYQDPGQGSRPGCSFSSQRCQHARL